MNYKYLYEKEKRLAETNLKDSEEFQDNMCNHRCILNSKVEELEEELEKEKEKNKKAIDFINNENNYFEDGENWQNILKIKEILEE